MQHVKLFEQFLEENKVQLPTWLFEDPEDFEEWYEDGMELEKGSLAALSSADEKKLLGLVKIWADAEEDYRNGRGDLGTGRTGAARAASYKAQDDIKQMLTQKGKVVFEELLAEKSPMEVTSKDDMRINDIIRKSGGDNAKAEALAKTMASRITDYYKAIRRASAAQSAGRSDLAQIFRDRSKQLNEELVEESDMGPIKMGSIFVKKEGKSQMNGKKGMFDAVEGDTLKITGVMDDGKEFRGVVQSKYGNDQVLVSASQLKSWERTK